MALSYKEIRSLSYDELVRRHDDCANQMNDHVHYLLEEIKRRDQERHTLQIVGYTRLMLILTVVVTILTAINVIVVLAPTAFQ